MTEKLQNFPPVYYISLEESQDRQQSLEKKFQEFGIENYTPMIFKRVAECNDKIYGPLVEIMKSSSRGAVTSHLKSIKKWIMETDAPYAIFFEDDVSFETVQYWNFTWNDFINNLPADWEAVQLMWVRPHMVKTELRERYYDDYSATAFMVKRDYGIKLISRFMLSDEDFNFDLGEVPPLVENIIFSCGKVYTFPLLVEDVKLPSTSINSPEYDPSLIDNGQGEYHHYSYSEILNWWKNIGCRTSLNKLMNVGIFPNDYDWGKFSPELIASLKKECGRNNIYKRYSTIKPGDVVVDIGASVGPFTYSILSDKPKVVYCVEPSKDLFGSLVRNTSKHTLETPIVYINKAIISNTLDDVRVFSGNENVYGGNYDFDYFTFQDFIRDYQVSHIDFLKMDCEGGEYNVFTDENIDWILNNVKNMAIEFHLTYPGSKEKFRNFRNKYLDLFNDYIVLSNEYQNINTGFELNLTRYIFDDNFFNNYWGELMIYIRNQ